MEKQTKKIAFCGVLGALAVAVMILGALIGIGTYAAPALTGIALLPVVAEYGAGTAALLYAAVSVLSVLLVPDKESAFLFVFLGWYPAARPAYNRLRPKALAALLKFLTFNAAVAAAYALLIYVFRVSAVVSDYGAASSLLLAGLAAVGNITFFVYDIALARLARAYERKLRPHLGGRS